MPVNQEVTETFQQLKLGKSLKYIVFGMNPTNTEIVVLQKGDSDDYEEFVGHLPEDECRYAVYDFHWQKGDEGKRSKICFIHWSPDTAKVKAKMISASSKDTIRKTLTGVSAEVQATDFAEVEYDTVLDKVSRGGR